jgi:hypothetical protein
MTGRFPRRWDVYERLGLTMAVLFNATTVLAKKYKLST